MSNVKNIDTDKYEITFTVDAKRFNEGLEYSFKKNQSYFNIKGFRKGKVPRNIIEKTFGESVFYEDAFEFIFPDAYIEALKESKLTVVSKPEVNVSSVSKKDGVTFSAIVYTKPKVTLPEYKGLSCKKETYTVTKEDVEKVLQENLKKYEKTISVDNRPVEKGDVVNIDYEGFIEDKPFEGGKGTGYDLLIGSNTFIDNFEEQLIGKNIGDEVLINVTFPKEYHHEALASKNATFKVLINGIYIKEVPELTDAFVQDITEFENIKDYKKDIKTKLTAAKKEEAEAKMKEELLSALLEKADLNIPKQMVDLELENETARFKNMLMQNGLSASEFSRVTGQNIDNIISNLKPNVEREIKCSLLLEAIIEKEKIKATEKDLTTYFENSPKPPTENDKKFATLNIQNKKALDLLLKNANFIE